MASNLPPTQKENWAPNEVVKPEHTNSWGRAINTLSKAVPLYSACGNVYTATYTNNVYNLTPLSFNDNTSNVTVDSYVDSMSVIFQCPTNNLANCSVNVNSLGAKTIKTIDNVNLPAGKLNSGVFVELKYDKINDCFKFQQDFNKADRDFSNLTETGKENILSMIYPIGSIYMSINEVNPSILFGFGEWEQIKDRFLLASGDNYSLASIGGEATHSLTVEEMPSHTHSASTDNTGEHSHSRGSMEISGGLGFGEGFIKVTNATQWGALAQNVVSHDYAGAPKQHGYRTSAIDFYASRNWTGATSSNGSHSHTVTVNNTGNSNSHNNMPPYLAVNIWKRIA